MVVFYVTGFGKFGPVIHNPTTQLIQRLREEQSYLAQHDTLEAVVLEVSAQGSMEVLKERWQRMDENHDPKESILFLHLGVDTTRSSFNLETSAYNCANFSFPDERGWKACNETIRPDGPAVLQCTLPLEDTWKQLCDEGFDVSISDNPGRYICNYVYYQSLTRTSSKDREGLYSLFLHVPTFEAITEEVQCKFLHRLLALLRHQLVEL